MNNNWKEDMGGSNKGEGIGDVRTSKGNQDAWWFEIISSELHLLYLK